MYSIKPESEDLKRLAFENKSSINNISNQLTTKDLLLFWHFTINAIDEVEIVSNQNLSVEMFLIRSSRFIKRNKARCENSWCRS